MLSIRYPLTKLSVYAQHPPSAYKTFSLCSASANRIQHFPLMLSIHHPTKFSADAQHPPSVYKIFSLCPASAITHTKLSSYAQHPPSAYKTANIRPQCLVPIQINFVDVKTQGRISHVWTPLTSSKY